ncbi:MAG TPA: lysophospholipid acyltransferase family protein, partial [Bryobacteraceae bacterium]|nr:lysophospholipid acyltransferase family protein [Bryobacteraceae bacterium]
MALLWTLLWVDPLIIVSTIFFGSLSVIFSLFDKSGRTMMAVARVWARSLVRIARVRVTVEGLEKIDPDAAYVFTANHLSYMDTPVVLANIPARFRFLAKKGLFQIPFLGWHLGRAGHIRVPRGDARAAVKTMHLAAQIVRDEGISLL